MKKFTSYLNENINIKGDCLVIVDVQKEFSKFMYKPTPEQYINNINSYCDQFGDVYQIWDGHIYEDEKLKEIEEPSYTFNKQKDAIRKIYGTTANKEVSELGEKILSSEKDIKQGDKFKVDDNFDLNDSGENYMVRVENNHKWFYVNKEIANFINTLIGKNVVIIGGADGECLKDVIVAMNSFGLKPTKNENYVYSAKNTKENQIQ